MDYEPFEVKSTAGQPYVGATLRMFPGPGGHMGAVIAWDATTGKIVWSNNERFSAWSGTLVTASDLVFYGTLEGYMKALDAKTGKELWRFKTASGSIGNPLTYNRPDGKEDIAILSGLGGWGGLGRAARLEGGREGVG